MSSSSHPDPCETSPRPSTVSALYPPTGSGSASSTQLHPLNVTINVSAGEMLTSKSSDDEYNEVVENGKINSSDDDDKDNDAQYERKSINHVLILSGEQQGK